MNDILMGTHTPKGGVEKLDLLFQFNKYFIFKGYRKVDIDQI